jgi:hypothetical protein
MEGRAGRSTRNASGFHDDTSCANSGLRWHRDTKVRQRSKYRVMLGGGSVFNGGAVDMATYNSFSNCMQNFAACNNIFYIKDGYVQQYTAIGIGGVRCYTNEALRPGFRGSTNFQ